MGVSTTNVRDAFAGDGTSNPRVTTFVVFEASDLRLVLFDGASNYISWLEGLDYTVAIATPLPGVATITPLAAIPVGHTLFAWRESGDTQEIDFVTSDTFPAERNEEMGDRAALRDQEFREQTLRSIRLPMTQAQVDMELPRESDIVSYDGKLLALDASGAPQLVDVADLAPGSVTVSSLSQQLLSQTGWEGWQDFLGFVAYDPEQNIREVKQLKGEAALFRGSPGAHPKALWYETDTRRIFYSDGVTWVRVGIADFAFTALPAPSIEGLLLYDTTRRYLIRDTGAALLETRAPLPRGHIGGLGVTRLGNDELEIAPGQCRMGTAANPDLWDGYLDAALSKTLSASPGWVAGDGNSGRPSSGVPVGADIWSHLFLIAHTDGSVDAGYDSVINAVNLLSDSGYTYFRRLASWRTDGSGNFELVEQLGEFFYWTSPPDAVNVASADFTSADAAITLPWVPPDIQVKVAFTANEGGTLASGSDRKVAFRSGGQAIGPVEATEWRDEPMGQLHGNGVDRAVHMELLTNANQQIAFRTRTDPAVEVNLDVHYYQDFRGKFD